MQKNGFLVLDTNIWIYKTRLLSTSLGAAVIYSLTQTKQKLALPEVIEEEIRKHTLKTGGKAAKEIQENYRLIEQLMGSRDDYQIPSDDDFISLVDSRLIELNKFIYKVEFNFNHAKSALRRVLEESQPNGYKNQQFKDSAIWEAILELAKDGDVDFVTEDKAFFQDSKPPKLADNLAKDCNSVPNKIRIFYELQTYLEATKEERPSVDNGKIIEKINKSIVQELSERAIDKGYKLGDISKSQVLTFLTEKPGLIAIEFEINYIALEVLILESGVLTEAILVVIGSCGCNLVDYEISDVQFDSIMMLSKEGLSIPSYGITYLRCESLALGRKTIPYRFKEPLN